MSAKKMYRYLLLIFVGGLALSVWIVRYANTQLSATSAELSTLRGDIAGLQQKREGLEKAKLYMNENRYMLDTLAKTVPTDKDQARVVGEIYSIADKAGVTIESVGFPASTLGSDTPAPAAASSTTASGTTTGSKSTATAPTKSISQATPLKDIQGVQSIVLSIGAINSKALPPGSGVTYAELMSFIRQVERNQRAIQITALGIGQDKVVNGEPTFNLTISLTIFIQS